jgi:adenosine deaminase
MVTLNSDDPAMLNCTLSGEYREVATRFGIGGSTIRRLASNAIEASWAADSTKARLRRSLAAWWDSD